MYTAVAPVYATLVPLVASRARALGAQWLNVQDGESVLDVGTGPGGPTRHLAAATPSGWTEGVDRTPAMVRRARRRLASLPHRRYGLRRAEATALPYPDDAFDALFSSYVLDVLSPSDRSVALSEMRRVLRSAGRLVLVYMAPPQHTADRLWAALGRHCPPLLGGDRPIDLPALLPEHGLDVQAQTTCTQLGLRSGLLRARPA
jgi:ubiquinone/menaquinone biosynthesis C-methylase UbiE